jgi:D-cysteine desulfhydrase
VRFFCSTPLQELSRLSKNILITIFIKRDDNTGLASGGNKTRKLEYLIKQALDENCDTIITAGHSNQITVDKLPPHAGLKCHLLLGGTKPEVYDGNLLSTGAEIHFTAEAEKTERIEK